MSVAGFGWTKWASKLSGPHFAEFQAALTKYNADRFRPALPEEAPRGELAREHAVANAEIAFIEAQRKELARLAARIPSEPDRFIAWFEELKATGPGQGDPLFPWLAQSASADQMKWFLLQEVAGEAGFDDLLAMTQVKMSVALPCEARDGSQLLGRNGARRQQGDARPDAGAPRELFRACSDARDRGA